MKEGDGRVFKYKYMKRLFWEAVAVAVLSAAGAIGWFVLKGLSMLAVILAFICILGVCLAVFVTLYSRLYFRMEGVMDAADQSFIMLRPRAHHYAVYGSHSFAKKLKDILPQRSEISIDEYENFYTTLSQHSDIVNGDIYYRYKTADEELYLKFKRVTDRGLASLLVIDVTDIYLQRVYMMQNDYFDTQSRLFSRDATLARAQQFIDDGCKTGCFAILSVDGIDKELASEGDDINSALVEIGVYLKSLSTKRIVIGKDAQNSFLFFFAGANIDVNYELSRIIASARKILSDMAPGYNRISVACGCCMYPEHATNAQSLISKAEFAMHEARSSGARNSVMFSAERFASEIIEQSKAKAVHEILSSGNIAHMFQPIVNAHNGKIFAYEALMRPLGDSGLTPSDVIRTATKDNLLLEVERLTFMSVLKRIEENEHLLKDRKVFINSIPNFLIPDEEFDEIRDRYAHLFKHTVIEITEDINFSDESFDKFRSRFLELDCQLALDDYGTGYSNEANLLKYRPSYLKMDKALIENIDTDRRKRSLVEGIVSFAKKHNIKIIAEGVETRTELESAISLNVDLIQGFYTARPDTQMQEDIQKEISDHIVALNLKLKSNGDRSSFETNEPCDINIVDLALQGYSDIVIKHSPVRLIGDLAQTAEISVLVDDELDAEVTFENCAISRHSGYQYLFTVGDNSNVTAVIKGENRFSGGFNVPSGSELSVVGDGSCEMMLTNSNPVAFGSLSENGYGKIDFALTGKCKITAVGDNCVAFGGQYGAMLSDIMIRNADITIDQRGKLCVGVGAESGNTAIGIYNTKLSVTCNGDSIIGIGTAKGNADIELSASDIYIDLGGDKATGVGLLGNGGGSINITDSCMLRTVIRAKSGISVGARDGNPEVFCNGSIIDIDAEGVEAIGIGDIDGDSIVQIKNSSIIRGKLASVSPKIISTCRGQIYIDSVNLITNTDFTSAINSRGKELCYYKLDMREDFVIEDYDNGDSGRYVARIYDRAPQYIGVCLPEGTLPEGIRVLQ